MVAEDMDSINQAVAIVLKDLGIASLLLREALFCLSPPDQKFFTIYINRNRLGLHLVK
jgi:uncharacterized membrane protein